MIEERTDRAAFDYYEKLAAEQDSYLKTLIDISRIITTSHNLEETLGQTVYLIAQRIGVDVCSIYLYEEAEKRLEMKATHGLNPAGVGEVRMEVTEGLVGMVIETRKPVNLMDVENHPRFKFFPSLDEEKLSSFLGIPLIEYRRPLGVLAIQNQESRLFTEEEERLLITIASQISGLISKAVMVERVQQAAEQAPPLERPETSFQLEGIPVAPGLAKEKVTILTHNRVEEPEYLTNRSSAEERQVLIQAVEESIQDILRVIHDLTARIGEQDAAIFHAHLLFLEDRNFIHRMFTQIVACGDIPGLIFKDELQG